MEVADVMMIEDREVIFFTQGGDYVAPLLSDGADGEGGGSSSGLPAVVGAYKVTPAVRLTNPSCMGTCRSLLPRK